MKIAKPARYPLWSPKAIVLISIPVIALTSVFVFWFSNRSIFVELQITLSLIALSLFIFLAVGLYKGVRLEKPGQVNVASPSAASPADVHPPTDLPKIHVDLPNVSDAGDDLIGCLLTIVFWVVMSVVALLLVWIIEQLLILTLPSVAVLLYWLFYRALRVVFARSRVCRGRVWRSLGYSLLYTVLYVGWLFGVVWVSQYVVGRGAA